MPTKVSPTIRRIQMIGGMLFLTSFLLPAMRFNAQGIYILRGYQCAEWSARCLLEALRVLHPGGDDDVQPWILVMMFGMCGLIIPLIIWYLLASPIWRRRIAILIGAFLIEMWIAVALSGIVPLIGHYVWVAGILLLLAPEISTWQEDSTEAPETLQL